MTTLAISTALPLAGAFLALGLLAGIALARVGRRRTGDAERARTQQLSRFLDEQRLAAVSDRDAAIHAAVEQVLSVTRQSADVQQRSLSAELDTKKSLIDQQLASMTGELGRVTDLVHQLERDRASKLGELTGALELQREQVAALAETTRGLREALSSTKARGQWGERMAEDVLRLAGFLEGVNYRRQRASEGGVPDFTFLLPDGMSLYMDVKFPLDNYLRYLEAGSELEKRRARDDFMRDVRTHVKTLAARGYGRGDATSVDCVLLFIPNEALYAFIQEQDRDVLDDALRQRLVFCSPLTLYAVLAVIRQAVDSFRIARTSDEILTRFAAFSKQWSAFTEKMEKLDRSLASARRDFDDLSGTRRRVLERELDRIDDLRRSRELDATETPTLRLEA
jgi:DNA recombination protein RmuC